MQSPSLEPDRPVDVFEVMMPEDAATFKTRIETSLTEIKTTLVWHARIGWGAVGAAVVVVFWLLNFYIPNQLSSYSTKADLKSETSPISTKIDTLSIKVENLSENLNKFMSMRLGGLIPDLEKAKKLPAGKLSASFQQANLLVDAALKSQVPAEPDLLATSRVNLRSIVRDASFPQSVRREALSADRVVRNTDAETVRSLGRSSRSPLSRNVGLSARPRRKSHVPSSLSCFAHIEYSKFSYHE